MLHLVRAVADHPLASDWPTTALVVAATQVWPWHLQRSLAAANVDNQRAAYGGTATVLSIIAGFIVSLIFFFASSESPTIEVFRENYGPLMNRTLIGAFLCLVFSVALTVAALLDIPHLLAARLFLAAVILAIVKLCRVALLAWMMLAGKYRDLIERELD